MRVDGLVYILSIFTTLYNLKLLTKNMAEIYLIQVVGSPVLDKATSVITFTAATAAEMFPNADDYLSNCVENLSQYNQAKPTHWIRHTKAMY